MAKTKTDTEPQETEVPEAEAGEEESVPSSEGSTAEDLTGFDGQRVLMEMISDPEVQAVLAARREGRAIQVVNANSQAEPEPVITDDDLEPFDDDIKKLVGLLDKQISSKLDPLVEKVGVLEGLAQGMQRQAVDNQIKSVADKYPDFPKYRKAMSDLAKSEGMTGLGVEELFLIAKSRAGELDITEPSTHTEKPTPTPRRKGSLDKKKELPQGKRRFQGVLADALDRIDLPQ